MQGGARRCSDEGLVRGQRLVQGLGCGGVTGGGGEVNKGVLGGNLWVYGGGGKMIPLVGLGDLPLKVEAAVVLPFRNVKFL